MARCGCVILVLLFLYGCGKFNPPVDYYQKVVEIEENEGRPQQGDEQRYSEMAMSSETLGTVKVVRLPPQEPQMQELLPKPPWQQDRENLTVKNEGELKETPAEPLQNEGVVEQTTHSLPPLVSGSNASEPIAVSSEVIRRALESVGIGISVRTIELVNGRLSGGRNSVRVSFFCESASLINDKFVAICAVTYHLNKTTNTIDAVVGIAEDAQSNLIGVLQSDMGDIAAWMTNKISRAEWFSRITKKMF